jgi:cell division protease FtsH
MLSAVDQEVRAILERAIQDCTRRLEAHRTELAAVANFLLEHETMSAEEFEAVFSEEEKS